MKDGKAGGVKFFLYNRQGKISMAWGDMGVTLISMKEEVEIDEAKFKLNQKPQNTPYKLYHKDFSSAMQHAYDHAKKKGFVVDPKEIDDKVAVGPKKPSSGKTNRYILGTDKRQKVHIQVANLDNKRYELNMYIEGKDVKNPLNKIKEALTRMKERSLAEKPENKPPIEEAYEDWLHDEAKKVQHKWKRMNTRARVKWLAQIKIKADKEDMSQEVMDDILSDYNLLKFDNEKVYNLAREVKPKWKRMSTVERTRWVDKMHDIAKKAHTSDADVESILDDFGLKIKEEVEMDEASKMANKLVIMHDAKLIAKMRPGDEKESKISDLEKKAKKFGFSRREYEEIIDKQGAYDEEVEIDEGTVLDVKDTDKWIKEIEKGIDAPWIQVRKSTLGGDENVAIMIKLSLDAEKDWNNKILHNSRYAMISLGANGNLEMFAKGRQMKNMRKTKIKSAKDAIGKINTWIKKVDEEVEMDEGTSLQVKMALSDVGLKGTWKNGKVYVKKRDVKKAEKALKGNVIYRGKPPVVVGENFFNKIREVIDLKKSSMGTVIKDFQDSDAPQFKGKSDKKRREMAIAAKLAADRNESVKEDEKDDPKSKKKDKINLKPKMDEKMAKTYKEMLKYIKKEKKSTEEVKEAVTDGGIEYGEQDWDAHYRLDHAYPNLGVNYAEFHEQELEGPYQIDGAAYFFDRKVGSWYSVESEDYVDDEKSKELSFRYVKDGMYKPQFSN
jgi:hypothetical protein